MMKLGKDQPQYLSSQVEDKRPAVKKGKSQNKLSSSKTSHHDVKSKLRDVKDLKIDKRRLRDFKDSSPPSSSSTPKSPSTPRSSTSTPSTSTSTSVVEHISLDISSIDTQTTPHIPVDDHDQLLNVYHSLPSSRRSSSSSFSSSSLPPLPSSSSSSLSSSVVNSSSLTMEESKFLFLEEVRVGDEVDLTSSSSPIAVTASHSFNLFNQRLVRFLSSSPSLLSPLHHISKHIIIIY